MGAAVVVGAAVGARVVVVMGLGGSVVSGGRVGPKQLSALQQAVQSGVSFQVVGSIEHPPSALPSMHSYGASDAQCAVAHSASVHKGQIGGFVGTGVVGGFVGGLVGFGVVVVGSVGPRQLMTLQHKVHAGEFFQIVAFGAQPPFASPFIHS